MNRPKSIRRTAKRITFPQWLMSIWACTLLLGVIGCYRAEEEQSVGKTQLSSTAQEVDSSSKAVVNRTRSHLPIPLGEAITDGAVEVEVAGLGGSTGDAILLTVRRTIPHRLRLSIDNGTVFTSITGAVQDMLAAGVKGERVSQNSYRATSEIELTDDEQHSYIIEAYCMNFHKANPGPSDRFQIGQRDDRARSIVEAGRSRSASIKAIQSALWIDRDSISVAELKSRFPVDDSDIQVARMLLDDIQQRR